MSVCPQWIFYTRLGGYRSYWRLPFLGCFRKLCNNLQNVVAITYIFVLQQSTFLVCNFLHFHFTINIFSENDIDSCIHFAGLKSPAESVSFPLRYFQNNIIGSLILVEELFKRNIKKFIFSSSAAVYGEPEFVPITEDCPKGEIASPYGRTKSMIEDILMDASAADKEFSCAIIVNSAKKLH